MPFEYAVCRQLCADFKGVYCDFRGHEEKRKGAQKVLRALFSAKDLYV